MAIAGTTIQERYEIKDTIGFGGFATTYRALDTITGEIVAVKECRNVQQKDREKISREAQIMRELSVCAGIVKIRDYIELEEATYIVMDYVEGITLKAHIERHGNLSMKQALELLRPVMESLILVHQKGLLHRDISPDNLMLQPDGTLKLLDFGAARNVSDETEKTMTMVLKPGYAPEEQYRSMSAQGTWTDVYALCATMYFCITGNAPVDSLQRMYEDVLKKPSKLRAQITPQEEAVLMHGLALRSENRISTINELLEHIEHATLYETVATHDQSQADQSQQSTHNQSQADQSQQSMYNQSQADQSQQSIYNPSQNIQNQQSTYSTSAGSGNVMKPGLKISKGLILAAIVVVFLLIAGVFIVSQNREPDDDELSGSYVYLSDQIITDQEMNELKKNEELRSLSFSTCTLSDDILKTLKTLDQVERLSLSDCIGFTSLEPLAEMTNLHDISISIYEEGMIFNGNEMFPVAYPYVTDLSLYLYELEDGTEFLEHFSQLSSLTLSGNDNEEDKNLIQLKDINFTKNMPELTYISLKDVDLLSDDISPLAACGSLNTIELNGNSITNIDGISKCEKLAFLDLSDNQITSLATLKDNSVLKSVDVTNNQLTSLEGLENATQMWSLYAGQNELTDLEVLRDKTALETLDVGQNKLTSLKECENMVDLTELNVNHNQVSDLAGIENSTSLTTLRVKGNQLTSLELLRDRFPELNHLDVAENQINDLTPLSACEKLQILRADQNQLTTLKGLENKAELYAVSACENQISDISALTAAPQLYYIDLAHNEISNLEPLAGLSVDDKVLFLEDNQISDLTPLPTQGTYRCICVYQNPLTTYEKINGFLAEKLYLPDVGGTDYESLLKGEDVSICLVDVDKSRQASIKRFFNDHDRYVTIMTPEEADEDIQFTRDLVSMD
ncbi:MAG: protein kinase [Clostridia bacterium]|nr:protein kinase [Clostridia bacterium]